MAEDHDLLGNVARTAEAIKGLAEVVPIYPDVIQPAAREIGKALGTVGKAVNVLLAPLESVIWGYEKFQQIFVPLLEERLEGIAKDRLITPKLLIAGPTIEGLKYAGQEPSLRDMYVNLLATAMDRETAEKAHPAFAEIIRQLTPDEARIVQYLAVEKTTPQLTYTATYRTDEPGTRHVFPRPLFTLIQIDVDCEYPHLLASYLDNLRRLQIIGLGELRNAYLFINDERFIRLHNHPLVKQEKLYLESAKIMHTLLAGEFGLTAFGTQFCAACVTRAQ